MSLPVASGLTIEEAELRITYIQAGGPGGQNVNKVATAAQLRFDVWGSPSLPDEVKQRLAALAGSRLTRDGVIVITARRHRTQEANRQDAVGRLVDLIGQAAVRPVRRRPTRPSAGQRERRLDAKAHRSRLKQGRRDAPE